VIQEVNLTYLELRVSAKSAQNNLLKILFLIILADFHINEDVYSMNLTIIAYFFYMFD
jgi:hypothetical protein